MSAALVAVLMGSSSDYPVMKGAVEMLQRFSVAHEVRVLSAHRTPHDMLEYAATAESRGLAVLIALLAILFLKTLRGVQKLTVTFFGLSTSSLL